MNVNEFKILFSQLYLLLTSNDPKTVILLGFYSSIHGDIRRSKVKLNRRRNVRWERVVDNILSYFALGHIVWSIFIVRKWLLVYFVEFNEEKTKLSSILFKSSGKAIVYFGTWPWFLLLGVRYIYIFIFIYVRGFNKVMVIWNDRKTSTRVLTLSLS